MSPYRLHWNVPYSPGELKVVGYRNGEIVAEKSIKTAGKPAKIELVPDRKELYSNGEDISFVTVRVVDKDGNLCPNADNLVHFTVEGAGSIAAVGNGNAATTASFQADRRKAFSGQCMLFVKTSESNGVIDIKANSEGLVPGEVQLQTFD